MFWTIVALFWVVVVLVVMPPWFRYWAAVALICIAFVGVIAIGLGASS